MFLVIPKGAQKFPSVIIHNHHSGSKVQQNTFQNPKVMQSEVTLLFETIVTKYNTGGGVLCHVWWNSVMLKSKRQWYHHFLFCRMRGRSQKDLNTHVVVCSLKINFCDSWLITGRVAQCQWHSAPSWPDLGLLNSRRLPSTFSKKLNIQSLAFCIFNANEMQLQWPPTNNKDWKNIIYSFSFPRSSSSSSSSSWVAPWDKSTNPHGSETLFHRKEATSKKACTRTECTDVESGESEPFVLGAGGIRPSYLFTRHTPGCVFYSAAQVALKGQRGYFQHGGTLYNI